MILPQFNDVAGDNEKINGYLGSECFDNLRVFFSLWSDGSVWWTTFMGRTVVTDSRYPVPVY